MEDIFLAIVNETMRRDWLKVAPRENVSRFIFQRDGLDPMKRILQSEQIATEGNSEFMR